jgi:hypothetical protein
MGYNKSIVINNFLQGDTEMTYQEYLKKMNELAAEKWAAYDAGDYAKADAIQAEMDALVNPQAGEAGTAEDLIFDS